MAEGTGHPPNRRDLEDGIQQEIDAYARAKDPRVRQAIGFAIDREAIVQYLRRGMARVLQAGFARYAARSGLAQRLDFSLDDADDAGPQGARPTRDPWNAWVFETRLGANHQREASQRES